MGWVYLVWVFVVVFVWFTDLRLCGLLRVVWLVYAVFGLWLLGFGFGCWWVCGFGDYRFVDSVLGMGCFCGCIWLLVMLFVVGCVGWVL